MNGSMIVSVYGKHGSVCGQSETKQGRKMMTGPTKDAVITMTRWHLKCEQEGTLHLYTRVVGNAGVVGGKL